MQIELTLSLEKVYADFVFAPLPDHDHYDATSTTSLTTTSYWNLRTTPANTALADAIIIRQNFIR